MKKVLIALCVIWALAATGCAVYVYTQYHSMSKEKDTLIQQNGELQNSIDAIGPYGYVYTVRANVEHGQEIKAEDLVEQMIPEASITESYVMNTTSIIGKFYKVDITPGTSITNDLIMDDPMNEVMYERDLTFSYLPLGIKVGDYIDIRMVLPYGEEFIVIEHERVYQLVPSTNTIKVKLNEVQLALWTSALTDKALYESKGLTLYVTKYVEPGIQTEVLPYYPVRSEMERVVTLNPNIANKEDCINTELRTEIDKMLSKVTDVDGAAIGAGRANESTNINTARDVYIPNKSNTTNDTSGDKESLKDVSEDLQEIGDSVFMNTGYDYEGNADGVTKNEQINAEGEDVGLDDEEEIE